MQRYFEADTTPEEEKELAIYAAGTDDPLFEELRGVLGYLSIGRERKRRKVRAVHILSYSAVAASMAVMIAIGFGIQKRDKADDQLTINAYGEVSSDKKTVMAEVDASLADFFSVANPAEANLIEIFKR